MAIDFVSQLSPQSNIRSSASNAQQRIALLRAQGFNDAADVFEQSVANKIQNKDATIAKDFEELAKFYGANIKRERAEGSPPEDVTKKQAYTAATIAEVNSLMERSAKSGQPVDQGLADSIINLAKSDPEEARKIARESIPVAPPLSVGDQIALEKRAEEKVVQQQTASNVADKSTRMVELMTELKTHPGFENLFGATAWPTWIAGSPGADAKALLKQIDALGFMESIKDMKGMGALSNAEGEKASAAFVGITPDMSEAAAKKKIEEVVKYIKKGQERIQSGKLIETKENKGPSISGANSYFNQFNPPPVR